MLVVTLLLTSAYAESPVARVVELINDLKAKATADGKTEQAVYDKYACWCEETLARKAGAITDAKASIDDLSRAILEAKGRLGSFGAEIAKLKKDIAENQESSSKAEEIRSNEHADYIQEKGQLEQGIANLKKAVQVLSDGTTGSAAMVETRMLTVAAGVRSAMAVYSRHNDANTDDYSAVRSFLGNPVSWVQAGANPATQTYNHQSGAIQGILAQMLEDFETNLASSQQDEDAKQTAYDKFKGNKATELTMLSDTLVKKESENGGDARSLAENSQEREETEGQLKTDEAFFETTTDACKAEADKWATRSRLRTEELAGMNQAVDILTSDDALASFAGSEGTFVQTRTMRSSRAKAYNILSGVASKTHSLSLAAMASSVYVSGHFDSVIADVQKQIENLRAEEKADEDHKHWCETERNNANAKNENLEADKQQLEQKMNRLATKKGEHEATILKTEGEIADLTTAMEGALSNRNAENAAFKQALKDDTNAVMLVAKAIEALSAFYSNNEAALLQKPHRALVHKHKDPEYGASADTPPPATAEYGGRGSETTGIVSILTMIREDTENEMQVARAEEGEAVAAYQKQVGESKESMNRLKQKVSTQQSRIAEAMKSSADAQAVHDDKSSSKDATDAYLNDLKESCDWIDRTYETRRTKRKAEIQSMQDAKGALAGAAPGLIATAHSTSKREVVDEELKELNDMEQSYSFLQRRA